MHFPAPPLSRERDREHTANDATTPPPGDPHPLELERLRPARCHTAQTGSGGVSAERDVKKLSNFFF